MADFLDAINRQRNDQRVAPLPFVLEREDEEDGLRCYLALAWTEATDEDIRSFVNTIPTRDGGTHELGMLAAVGTAVQRFMETHDLVKKGMEIKREDIREGLTAVLAVCVHEPQFQGQTKGRLNNPEIKAQVESMTRPALENFLLKNKSVGDAIAARVIQAAKAREASRAAASQVRRKTAISGRLNLPGKLHDCDSTNPEESELFIVEGDSAGGSAKQGRDRDIQAILPLKGKVLNAEQAGKAKVLDNKELTDIISALGCGMDDQYDPGRLRYGKVILLTDADSDGHHIATLLAHLLLPSCPGPFHRRAHLPGLPAALQDLLGQGNLSGRPTTPRRDRILAKLPKNAKPNITRFKGLGEMPAKLLLRDDARPGPPPAAPRRRSRRRPPLHRPHRQRPDGQGARGPLQVHHGRSLYCQGHRYLSVPSSTRQQSGMKARDPFAGRLILVVAVVVALGLCWAKWGAAVEASNRGSVQVRLGPRRPGRGRVRTRDWERAVELTRPDAQIRSRRRSEHSVSTPGRRLEWNTTKPPRQSTRAGSPMPQLEPEDLFVLGLMNARANQFDRSASSSGPRLTARETRAQSCSTTWRDSSASMQRLDEAADAARRLSPHARVWEARGLLLLGEILALLDDPKGSADVLRNALEREPKSSDAPLPLSHYRKRLARGLLRLGQPAEAAHCPRRGLQRRQCRQLRHRSPVAHEPRLASAKAISKKPPPRWRSPAHTAPKTRSFPSRARMWARRAVSRATANIARSPRKEPARSHLSPWPELARAPSARRAPGRPRRSQGHAHVRARERPDQGSTPALATRPSISWSSMPSESATST